MVVLGVGAVCAGGSPLALAREIVAARDADVAVGDRDRDARVLEQALLRPPRGPARLARALRNLGLVGLRLDSEVRLDGQVTVV